MYDEILKVPLLIKWPHGAFSGVVNSIPCSGVDIAPTLLGQAGLSSEGMPGAHLQTLNGEAPILAGTLERAVVSGGFKGIFGGRQPPRLFNLIDDPGELVDVAAQRPDILEELEGILESRRRQALALYRSFGPQGADERVDLSERERERLEAFGYLQ
jgi:arylsulfatase A-like enzyme